MTAFSIKMITNIPEELKKKGLFCLYNERKVPLQINGDYARPNDPNTFTNFQKALNALKANTNKFKGLGLQISNSLVAIDIDNCVGKDKHLTDLATELISTFKSYTEISQSGNGIHIIFKAQTLSIVKEKYRTIKKLGPNKFGKEMALEIHIAGITNRYIALTGNVILSAGIEERTSELLSILNKYMKRDNLNSNNKTNVVATNTQKKYNPAYLDKTTLLEKAFNAQNGAKFKKLWYGDNSGFPSTSEADQAFFNMLAFWCNGDEATMRDLAMQSNRVRNKWLKHPTYISGTINNSLKAVNDFYKSPYQSTTIDKTPQEEISKNTEGAHQMNDGNQSENSTKDKKDEEKGHYLDKLATALEQDPQLNSGCIFKDTFSGTIMREGKLPWSDKEERQQFTDDDDSSLRRYADQKYGIPHFQRNFVDAFRCFISKHARNLLHEKLINLHTNWDKQYGHIRNLLPKYLGADNSDFNFEAMKTWMLGAIARAFKPGIQFDYMLILVGAQGIGKSSFFRMLALSHDWGTESVTIFEGKEMMGKLQKSWIVVTSELMALKRAHEVGIIKDFLTRTHDAFRVPYEKYPTNFGRHCVFGGTTNDSAFLSDVTGNRRFLIIHCNSKKDLFSQKYAEIKKEIEQAWGEAMNIYTRYKDELCKVLILPEYVRAEQERINASETYVDEREGLIEQYLEKGLPDDWDNMAIEERRDWLRLNALRINNPKIKERETVSIAEIWCECFGNELKDKKKKDSLEIAEMLKHLGWEINNSNRAYLKNYGRQKIYTKITK